MQKNNQIKGILVLGLILIFAAFFRFFALDSMPPGLYPDEAVNAMDGLRALEDGDLKVYYPNNNGREGLFINSLAVVFKFFGSNIVLLRMVPALIGLLTILSAYFLGKTILDRKMGLLFAAFFALSFWHIMFSRIGFRAILVPLILNLTFIFLFKGYNLLLKKYDSSDFLLKEKFSIKAIFRNCLKAFKKYRLWNFLIAGFCFGLGFYTYIAFRISPVIVLVFFALLFLSLAINKKKPKFIFRSPFKASAFAFILFLFATLISSSLIIHHFLTSPDALSSRRNDNSISVFDPKNNDGKLVSATSKNILTTLGQFYFLGDNNWRHNLPPKPELNALEALFFTFGIAISLLIVIVLILYFFDIQIKNKKIAYLYEIKNKKHLLTISLVFLSWFFIMLSPAFLTVEGLPHALRSIGSLGAVYFFIAYAAYWFLYFKPDQEIKNNKTFFAYCLNYKLIIMAIILSGLFTYYNYFIVWGKSSQAAHAFEITQVNIGKYLKDNTNDNKKRFLIVNINTKKINTGYPVSLETIRFIAYNHLNNTEFVLSDNAKELDNLEKENIEILFQRRDQELIDFYKENYNFSEKLIYYTPEFEGSEIIILEK